MNVQALTLPSAFHSLLYKEKQRIPLNQPFMATDVPRFSRKYLKIRPPSWINKIFYWYTTYSPQIPEYPQIYDAISPIKQLAVWVPVVLTDVVRWHTDLKNRTGLSNEHLFLGNWSQRQPYWRDHLRSTVALQKRK